MVIKSTGANRELCWKVHDCTQSFVLGSYTVHELCNKMFLLVSSSVCRKQLVYFVHGQGQKPKQKHTTNFVEFHNHFSLLTMD